MAVKYDIYVTPSSSEEEVEPTYYAKVIPRGTVTTSQLAQLIERESTLTTGDVRMVLASLSYHLGESLLHGDRVHLEGLGFFQLSVTAPVVKDPKKMRADYLQVKTINFLPEKRLKSALRKISFERTHTRRHSPVYTDEEIILQLEDYFASHHYILRSDFERLFRFTKSMALKQLKGLVEKGVLIKGGTARFPVYERGREI